MRFLSKDAATEELLSPLSLEECVRRLRDAIDGPWRLRGKRAVTGSVDEARFRGWKRVSYRNSFQTEVIATFVADRDQTRIHCRFGLSPFVVAFIAIWACGVLWIGGQIFVASIAAMLRGATDLNQQFMGIVVPPALLAFLWGLVWLGRRLARDEREFLTQFLCATLQACRVERSPIPQ